MRSSNGTPKPGAPNRTNGTPTGTTMTAQELHDIYKAYLEAEQNTPGYVPAPRPDWWPDDLPDRMVPPAVAKRMRIKQRAELAFSKDYACVYDETVPIRVNYDYEGIRFVHGRSVEVDGRQITAEDGVIGWIDVDLPDGIVLANLGRDVSKAPEVHVMVYAKPKI